MNLFYTQAIDQGYALLPESESKHAIQVLRLQRGDQIHFVDGRGVLYEGMIDQPHPKKCLIKISNQTVDFEKRGYYLHLVIAPTKNIDRFEWVLEKATEMGIDRITPVICAHSERKIVKRDRSERVILSALKQSLKAFLPRLDDVIRLDDFIREERSGQKMIAHCQSSDRIEMKTILRPLGEQVILIGPEGDFSPEEIKRAESQGYQSISLGTSRLRTETAALVACSSVYIINTQG